MLSFFVVVINFCKYFHALHSTISRDCGRNFSSIEQKLIYNYFISTYRITKIIYTLLERIIVRYLFAYVIGMFSKCSFFFCFDRFFFFQSLMLFLLLTALLLQNKTKKNHVVFFFCFVAATDFYVNIWHITQ